jgi:hypothetical protein
MPEPTSKSADYLASLMMGSGCDGGSLKATRTTEESAPVCPKLPHNPRILLTRARAHCAGSAAAYLGNSSLRRMCRCRHFAGGTHRCTRTGGHRHRTHLCASSVRRGHHPRSRWSVHRVPICGPPHRRCRPRHRALPADCVPPFACQSTSIEQSSSCTARRCTRSRTQRGWAW